MNEFNERYIEFCKPFIDAIKDIYSTMMMMEVSPGAPKVKVGSKGFGKYSSIMGINGSYVHNGVSKEFRGSLVLSWPEETYLRTASAMLMEEYTEYSDEIADVGMEIANMCMGNAKKVLVTKGYKIDMSIPTSVKGDGHEIKVQLGVITIQTPLKSGIGEFIIELNYQDNNA